MESLITSEMTLDEVRRVFSDDKFASGAGCMVLEAQKGYAKCEMPITPNHLNGTGSVMGGAIFTLADFTLAIASNMDEAPTVSVSNTIEYCSTAKGEKLIGECHVDKSGRSLGFYTVDVTDDTGRYVARMVATCHRRS